MALRRTHDPITHTHEPYVMRDEAEVEETSTWERFSIAQGVSLAIGVFFVVTGTIGLARTGFGDLMSSTTRVGGMTMTPLLGLIHLGVGVIAFLGVIGRLAARTVNLFLGAVLLAAGIVALVQPMQSMGWTQGNGIAYLITGVVAIIAAVVSPLSAYSTRHHEYVRRADRSPGPLR